MNGAVVMPCIAIVILATSLNSLTFTLLHSVNHSHLICRSLFLMIVLYALGAVVLWLIISNGKILFQICVA